MCGFFDGFCKCCDFSVFVVGILDALCRGTDCWNLVQYKYNKEPRGTVSVIVQASVLWGALSRMLGGEGGGGGWTV